MDLTKKIGLRDDVTSDLDPKTTEYLNLKLAFLGLPTFGHAENEQMISALLLHQQETSRLLAGYLCPADARHSRFSGIIFKGRQR